MKIDTVQHLLEMLDKINSVAQIDMIDVRVTTRDQDVVTFEYRTKRPDPLFVNLEGPDANPLLDFSS